MNDVPALAARLANIAPFHVMEIAKMAAALEAQGRDIIHMGIGEPDFTAAQPVLDAAARAMAEGSMKYTSATGMPELRQAISTYYQRVFGLEVDPGRIVVTAGASAALLLACAALVENGMRVLMPDPSYPCNRHFVAAFGGAATLIPSAPEQRFQLTDEMVREHWDAQTGGVLLASPSNPTGTSIPSAELEKIIATTRARGGFAIVDEIYQGLSYDARPFSALAFSRPDGEADNLIVINSFSKYFNMTGWRLGWMVVPRQMVPAIEKLSQNLFICPSSLAQYAGLACFQPQALAIYEERKEEFRRRRDYIVPALERLGFTVPVKPDGAFYVYADCSGLLGPGIEDADRLTVDILNRAGVVIVPGLDFGPATSHDYVRISYATSMEKLVEAIGRLERYLEKRRASAA